MTQKKRFELDQERLATTNESGQRVYLYPEDTRGVWINRRHLVYWFLLAVFFVLPWIKVNGRPALMLNIFTREFTFMGLALNGIEPILFFLVVAAGLFFIGFVTSLFGRVWCGWACPQTVFIQVLFSKIERLIEGKARNRKAMNEGPWTFNKALKKTLKWSLFLALSLLLVHTFLSYIVGTKKVLSMVQGPPHENLGLFITMLIMTAIILVDFGWFREQFCIIACPYGRMQSVLMDQNSLIVAYDEKRGEPRRGTVPSDKEGDCINCYACVKVCPTGIDIRRGTQLECIACTQCIDACDEIMVKVDRPKGLIKYTTENSLNGIESKKFSLRSLAYLCISVLFVSGLFFFFNRSTNISFVFMRGKGSPFEITTATDGKTILNHFTVKLAHQGEQHYALNFEVADKELKNKIDIITPNSPLIVDMNELKTTMFFAFSPDILSGGRRIFKMNVVDQNQKIIATQEVVLVGPTK